MIGNWSPPPRSSDVYKVRVLHSKTPHTKMTRSFSLFALSILFLSRLATSLEVSPGSTCAPLCIDSPGLNASDPRSSQTFTDDLVCTEDQYSSTDQGKKFKSCVDCLITSTHVDATTGESDLYWALCMLLSLT